MSRLKIKSDNGWFAATAGWQAAVEKPKRVAAFFDQFFQQFSW